MSTLYTGVAGAAPTAAATLPDDGDPLTAASANTALQPMIGDIATLQLRKAALAGAAFTGNVSTTGNLTVEGSTSLGNNTAVDTVGVTANMTVLGTFATEANTTLGNNAGVDTLTTNAIITNNGVTTNAAAVTNSANVINSALVTNNGTVIFNGKTRRRTLVYLSDGNHTIDPTEGNIFMLAEPTAERTITLQTATAPVPDNGDWMRLVLSSPSGNSAFRYLVKREGAGGDNVAIVDGYEGVVGPIAAKVEVQLDSGVWRGCDVGYGAHPGTHW